MSAAEPKSYWVFARFSFMGVALVSVVLHQPVIASVWLACSLVCHATRTILDAIERKVKEV